MRVYIATENIHKIKEAQGILNGIGIEVVPHSGYPSLKVEETAVTYEGNAAIKALALSKLTEDYVIADDSGLAVAGLNGSPGVYSARFAGIDATDEQNNSLLLERLNGIEDRRAKYICVIALAKSGKLIETFRGECEGNIALYPLSGNGFGYDPVFILKEGRRMSELSDVEKNMISHRKNALNKLYNYLKEMIW